MTAYLSWVGAGRPWTAATPIAELAALLRRYGYTVYILGDNSHLRASTPEDHTPYSATGWPVASPRWYVHALDIMPPSGNLPSLAVLGRQLAADKDAGVAGWIKYMNWSPQGQGCQHWKWQPDRTITSSSDVGHIHLSIRSDATHASIGSYDPVARIRGGGAASPARVETASAGAPAFPGHVLVNPTTGYGTRTWQQKMRSRGWNIVVDDRYGPASASICRQFQVEKRLIVDGKVGKQTWAATWSAPVT